MKIYKTSKKSIVQTQYHDPLLNHITKHILSHIPEKKNGTLLDIGCGVGRLAVLAAKKGYTVVGFDIEKKAIALANASVKQENVKKRCHFFVSDDKKFLKTKYAKQTYDVVVCSEVIEHVKNPQLIIDLAYKMLKKNGMCIFTTPHDPALWSVLDEYANHVKRFTLSEMKTLFQKFETVQSYTVGFPTMQCIIRMYRLFHKTLRLQHSAKWREDGNGNALYTFFGGLALRFDDLFNSLKKGTTIIYITKKSTDSV